MILDIIFAAILLFCIWFGAKRGFVKTAMGVVSLFIGLIASIYLYQPFTHMLYSIPQAAETINNIKAGITNAVLPVISQRTQNQLPQFLNSFISADIIKKGNMAIAGAVSDLVFSAGLLIAFILVIKFGIALCIRVMGVITKLPIIKQLNSFLGGVLGGINGVVFCFIAATILFIAASYPHNLWINENLIYSHIAKYFYDSNFLIKLIKLS